MKTKKCLYLVRKKQLVTSKKAITPIISIILLLLMTVVASGGVYFWMNSVQTDLQSGVESSVVNSFANQNTEFNIISTSCNSTADTINVILMNTGSVDISSGSLILSVSTSSGAVIESIINASFPGLSQSTSAQYLFTLVTTDLELSTLYTVKVTEPSGKSMSDSCTTFG